MSDRSWFSNLQGAADWATGNKWDFDNLGRPNTSVADNKPPGFSGNNSSGGYDSQFSKYADALNKSKMYSHLFGSNKNSVSPSISQSFASTGGTYKPLSSSTGMFFPETPGFQVVHPGGVSQGGGGSGGGGGSNPLSAAVSGIGTYGMLASNPVTAPLAIAGGVMSGLGKLFG